MPLSRLHPSLAPLCRRQKLEGERRELPAWSAREKLLALVKAHKTLIVVGETGSGKTTQIPQFLMQGGFAKEGGAIACTQPRRVAAVTVAKRVAEEMGVALGQQVSLLETATCVWSYFRVGKAARTWESSSGVDVRNSQ